MCSNDRMYCFYPSCPYCGFCCWSDVFLRKVSTHYFTYMCTHTVISCNEQSALTFDVFKAEKIGKIKDLSNFDKGPIMIAKHPA